MQLQGQVGGIVAKQSGPQNFRQGFLNDTIVSELHGRFYEANLNGQLFGAGSPAYVALSGNSITLVAATTPIIALWNPSTSGKNYEIIQAQLDLIPNSLTSGVGPGAFVWAYSVNNTALTLGSLAYNRFSLTTGASVAKFFPGGVALTGLTNNLVIGDKADFATSGVVTYTTLASTSPMPSISGVQNFDGSLIIPPGGLVALLNVTSSTTWSTAGRLSWIESAA